MINEEIQKNTISVQTQEGRRQGWVGYGQANVYQSFNTGLKREVKAENAPPGLSYGEVRQSFVAQRPKDRPKLTKPSEKDTDSMMTERDTTQNQQKREIPSNYAKEGPSRSESQRLPNADPDQNETSERYNRDIISGHL